MGICNWRAGYTECAVSDRASRPIGRTGDPAALAPARLALRGVPGRDADFARRWVANRGELAPRGTRLLRRELRQKGVDTELADQTLAEADLDDYETALALGAHRLERMRGLDSETQRRRLAGFLERRGFSYETVRRVDRALFPR